MAIRNVWSLNIDEALVVDKIKSTLGKDFEVFLPANVQFKNIDLILYNLKKNKIKSIQVKGSRTYEQNRAKVNLYGSGSAAWITIPEKSIFKPKNAVDFYIFVIHSFVNEINRKDIKIDYLVIPETQFKLFVKKKKIRGGGKYHFSIWIDSKGKRSFDFNNTSKVLDLSKYINNWSLLK